MLGTLFGWRRPDPGFEWHKYVRTTIKLRRDARREKAERFKQQAADGVKAAGAAAAQGAKAAGGAAAEGVKAAGAAAAQGAKVAGGAAADGAKAAGAAAAEGVKIAGSAAASGARAAGQAAGHAARIGAHNLGAGSRWAAIGLGHASRAGTWKAKAGLETVGGHMIGRLRPLLDILARRSIGGPLVLAGAIAVVGAIVRSYVIREFDREAAVAVGIGALCLVLALLPRLLIAEAGYLPGPLSRLTANGRKLIAGILALAAIAVGILQFMPGLPKLSWPGGWKLPSVATLPFGTSTKIVEGRAILAGVDMLRVGDQIFRLADIELPDREQTCQRPGNKRWRCGEAAAAAVAKLAGGRSLKCEIRGQDGQGNGLGVCLDGTTDINAQLVRGGHVFAGAGLMPRYASQENEARSAKAGLWGNDITERPAEWRNRLWEDAKKRAPSGCPIKGQVSGNTKSYVLPWAPDYERARVNTARGGRWFCSEEEAVAAGWKSAAK